jgi:dTDP-4-dehydrorhamnose reductase
MLFFSSDYVFDGLHGPYGEDAPVCPISEYGRQKAAAEQAIRQLLPCAHVIVRTTVVFGWEREGKNFVHRLVRNLRAGQPIRAPREQIGSPTYVVNLAGAVVELGERRLWGTWNIVGSELMGRYHFSLLAAEVFGLDASLIQPVSTEHLNQKAPRPLQAGLKIDKARSVLMTELWPAKRGLEHMRNHERDPISTLMERP